MTESTGARGTGAFERILVRMERCLSCHSCELACAVAHSRSAGLIGALEEYPKPQRRVFVEATDFGNLPFLCRHCEDAPCARSCPTGALFRDDAADLVRFEAGRCIGCHVCLMTCPFGMIQAGNGAEFIVKCDRCVRREGPACVAACPTRALVLEGEFLKRTRRNSAERLAEATTLGRTQPAG